MTARGLEQLPCDLERDGGFARPRRQRQKDALVALPKEYAAQKDMRAGQLNQVLVGIIEQVEADVPTSKQTLKDYAAVAHEVFGRDFPKLEIEYVLPK